LVTLQTEESSKWVSAEVILFFLVPLTAGFVLTMVGTTQSGSQDILFGSGIALWVTGVFGSVYCIVRRLAGRKAANLAVLALILILLAELFSGKGRENDYDPIDCRDY